MNEDQGRQIAEEKRSETLSATSSSFPSTARKENEKLGANVE